MLLLLLLLWRRGDLLVRLMRLLVVVRRLLRGMVVLALVSIVMRVWVRGHLGGAVHRRALALVHHVGRARRRMRLGQVAVLAMLALAIWRLVILIHRVHRHATILLLLMLRVVRLRVWPVGLVDLLMVGGYLPRNLRCREHIGRRVY